ncbi:hypothetical protein BDV98DRAFT_620407, partial [Pterulicium gracile]
MVRSVMLINVRLGTSAWSQLPIPRSLDLTAITLRCRLGDLTLLNVYNQCEDMTTMDLIHKLRRDGRLRKLSQHDNPSLWAGDFNCHHS